MDVDTAVVGETGTGAKVVFFVADLAMDVAVRRSGHVILGRIGSDEVSLFAGRPVSWVLRDRSERQRQLVLAEA